MALALALLLLLMVVKLLLLLLGKAEAWVRGGRARGSLICGRGQEGAALDGSEAGTTRHSLLGEVLSRLAGAQRHLCPPASRRAVVDWGQRPTCRYRIGGARLAQSAALVARLLELADSVFCKRRH